MAGHVAQRLYYDSDELEFRAKVTDIRLNSTVVGEAGEKQQLWQVALDRTAFYPESGGQPWDTGVLVATSRGGATLEVPVERVEEDESGEVWHFVRKPLVEGTEVEGRVDASRRVDHMQQHSGQHLLSAVFLRELGARTVSFHLGAESSTIDLQMPDGASETISEEDLRRVEQLANEAIFEDRAMRPAWVSREEAEAMLARGDLRKLPDRSGPMRIVEMQGVEFNACGGTHVRSTGAIGGLLIRRVEKVRGGPRVEFVCGLRAVRAAGEDFAALRAAGAALSVGPAEVPGRVAGLLDEVKAAGKERKALLTELAEAQAALLVGGAGNRNQEPGAAVVSAVFAGKGVEFAKLVGSRVAALGHAAVVGVRDGDSGAVAVARRPGSDVHAGNVLREVFAAAGARGGGSAEMAQGVCAAGQVEELMSRLAERIGQGV